MLWVPLALIAVMAAQAVPQSASQQQANVATKTLVVTYSDGNAHRRLLTPTGGSWTPYFPHRDDAPGQDGHALSALQIDHVVDRDVTVTVALLYGTVHQRRVKIATVRVTEAAPVRITELEAFGVDPVVLSIGALEPMTLAEPVVTSASALLDVAVELRRNDVPMYSIVFRNRAARAVTAVQFLTYTDGKQRGSGRRKNKRNTPLIEPGGEYGFTLPATGSQPGFERFEVSGVLWDDGSVEGDPYLKVSEDALAVGQVLQLRRVLTILRGVYPPDGVVAPPKTLLQLRDALERLPITAGDMKGVDGRAAQAVMSGQQFVKAAVLEDLAEYLRTPEASDAAPGSSWAGEELSRYSAWLNRIQGNR